MRSKVLGIVIQVVVMIIIVSVVLLLLVIGVQILIHACIVVGRTFRRGLSTTERGGSEGGGMSPEDLEQLPSYDFQAVAKSSSSNPIECAICLESFAMGEKCRMLPVCKHSFHAHCVDSWLVRTPVCPVCRTSCL